MTDQPVFVNSVPKSGTYLLAAILEELGLEFTHWHIFETFYDDYTDVPLQIARSNPQRCRVRQPVDRTISRLRPGQFAVGHLRYNERTRGALQDCYVIFLKRDLRECLVSHMRWQVATGRDRSAWTRIEDPQRRLLAYLSKWGRSFVHRARAIAEWEQRANLALAFNDLTDPEAIRRLAAALRTRLDTNVIPRALAGRSLTRLPQAIWPAPWGEEAERKLVAIAGISIAGKPSPSP